MDTGKKSSGEGRTERIDGETRGGKRAAARNERSGWLVRREAEKRDSNEDQQSGNIVIQAIKSTI